MFCKGVSFLAVNPKIKQLAEYIRSKRKARDVRESISSGLESMSEDVVENETRQSKVEQQFQVVLDETTGKDVISAPELLAARIGVDGTVYPNAKARIDAEQNETNRQLAQTEKKKADVTYVETLISQTTNGAIKGSFTTYLELTTAYPNGIDTGPFLVNENSNRYIWDVNKRKWVSIGPYEPAEIADKTVSELKTTFMEVSDEKDVTVNLIPDVLGTLGVYYDPSTGKPVTNDQTMTYKATGKITKGDFATMKSFGVQSWIFFTSANIRISSQELNPDVVTELAFPTDTAYVIGNIKDFYFPVNDPNRSPYPKGVATATIVKTNRKYNIKDLIIEDENLSEEIKATIEKEKQGKYAGKIVVNLGDSIIEATNPSISDVVADELGSTTINGGFGGCMMCPHPNAEYAKFSMTAVAEAIATGNWSIQENATGVPAAFKNTVARLKAVDWTQVYCVVISYGTNDWLNSNPLDNSSDKYDKASYLGALRYSIRKLLQAYPNLKILVTAPIFRSTNDRTENSTNWKNGSGLLMSGYVEGLNIVGKELFIPIADTFFGLGLNAWNESFYFPANDGTHPNAIGRQLLGQKIASTIRYVY